MIGSCVSIGAGTDRLWRDGEHDKKSRKCDHASGQDDDCGLSRLGHDIPKDGNALPSQSGRQQPPDRDAISDSE